jgi:flagellar assembly protein FliH
MKTDFVAFRGSEGPEKEWEIEGNLPQHIKERLLRESQNKASLMEKEAYEKGFAQGEKDGLELGEKKAMKVLEALENLLHGVDQLKKEILRRYEKELVDLVLAIARKVIHQFVQDQDGTVRDTVFQALSLAVERHKALIRVNPADYDCVERLRPEIFSKFKGMKSIMVTSDPSISRGGCYLETPYGGVDARMETQLDQILQVLHNAFSERRHDSS